MTFIEEKNKLEKEQFAFTVYKILLGKIVMAVRIAVYLQEKKHSLTEQFILLSVEILLNSVSPLASDPKSTS